MQVAPGLEKLTGSDICISNSDYPPITTNLINAYHALSFFVQIKHGEDLLNREQLKVELSRMLDIIPAQAQRYLLQVGKIEDYWRSKAIHRNWRNQGGVTDKIPKSSYLLNWCRMINNSSSMAQTVSTPYQKLTMISDYRRVLLAIPGIGPKAIVGLKSTNFFDALEELNKGKKGKNMMKFLGGEI